MTHLNNDVLALIINVIDDLTLFSLLTLNKYVFRLVCQVLYRDPAFFLLQKHGESFIKSTLSFLRLVLSISPVQDDDTIILRQILDVQTSPSSPMLDYLSLVRVIRWQDVIDERSIPESRMLNDRGIQYFERRGIRKMDYRSMPFVKHCLTRPICFYHLENLVELEVQYVAIEEYIQMASRLSRLKKLFVSNNRLDVEDAYLQAMCLVKAIQLHHGKDTLQECHVWNDIWDEPPISKWLHLKLELLSLLPIPEALKDLNIEPLRPMDRYLATLHQMYVTSPQDGFLALAASHYPDLQARHILQRCRSLASLTIDDAASLGQDGDILAWAAQEALDRATGRPVPPAVPLVDLTLGTCALDVRVARRLIKGALVGFKGSLTSLDIEFSPRWSSLERSDTADSAMFSGWPVGNENQVSSQTQEAYFPGIEPDPFDVRLLEACPKLTNLIIILYACLEGSSSTYRQWPRLRLPSLESMMLEGLATVLFDPMSLTSMSRLNYLSLRLYSSNTFPDPTSWLKRWTWDWHLPTLTTLSIDCGMQGWFSLRILRSCPQLSSLCLKATSECTLSVRSDLCDPCRDIFGQLTSLSIEGEWNIQSDDIPYLLHVLPCMEYLFISMSESISCQMIVATYNRPTIKSVTLSRDTLTMEKREEIGLYKRIDGDKGMNEDYGENGCKYIFRGLYGDEEWTRK